MYFQSHAVRSLERRWSFWMLVVLAAYVTLVTNRLAVNQSGTDPCYAVMYAASGGLACSRRRKKSGASKRLRICLYARCSTEEQDETSIPDQFAYCRKHLESLGIDLSTAIIKEVAEFRTSPPRSS